MPPSKVSPQERDQFIVTWMKYWEQDQLVNGQTVIARTSIRQQLIDPWKAASLCSGTDEACRLDMTQAPFRLESKSFNEKLFNLTREFTKWQVASGRVNARPSNAQISR